MRILFLGDVVGRDGRDAVVEQVPLLRKQYALDAVIVNGENAAAGFGITAQICDDFYRAGVDCITTGNHVWDQRAIVPYLSSAKALVRPLNFPEKTPGTGYTVISTVKGHKILVINIMGRLFMEMVDNPFTALDKVLATHRLTHEVQAIVVDVHAEATSEKQVMGYYLDGRVSLVVGTHTHTPSADTRLLPKGTGFQTEAGMCGVYEGVIGFKSELAVAKMVLKGPTEKLQPAEGAATLSGVIAEINHTTGLCTRIEPLIVGGSLRPCVPVF